MGESRTCSALLGLALLCACGPPEAPGDPWQGWHRRENAYARRFQVWERGDERMLLVFGHGGEQDTVGSYWLNRDVQGALPPVAAVTLSRSVGAVAVGSTTHIPFISALGRNRAIKACAHMDQVRDTVFVRQVKEGLVREIATGDGLDRELLLTLKPDVLFGYPFGRGEGDVLEGFGIPTIEVSEYLEEHPLGRAEWLRFFGVLFGEEHRADSLFKGIRERYEAIRVDSTATDRPTVLFGSVWEGQWWVPPGNSYMARLIQDAGGRYVFADRKGEGNIAVDMETMITVGAQADDWGMIADVPGEITLHTFTNGDARLSGFEAVRTRRLFIGNSATADLFGQAILEPDVVLGDLAFMLNMPRSVEPHSNKYFHRFADPELLRYFEWQSKMIDGHVEVEPADTAR